MITVPTVIVTGAGASCPYGFPLGSGLIDSILKLEPSLLSVKFGIEPLEFTPLRAKLLVSGTYSIDAFLEHNPELVEIGKQAIVLSLQPHETRAGLYNRGNNQDWYRYLWNAISTKKDEVLNNKLTIVTFNYDRSLEYYLLEAYKSLYQPTRSDMETFREKVKIIYVHGKLGTLEECPYGEPLTKSTLDTASKGVRIIHEDMDESLEFKDAKMAMTAANRIFFLGFGFHPTNMARLGVGQNTKHAKVICSGFGLSTPEQTRVASMFGHSVDMAFRIHNNLEVLREITLLDSN